MSVMAQAPFVDRAFGMLWKYGPEAGKGQWEGGAKEVVAASAEVAGVAIQRFILYLIKAGLLPVRFMPHLIKGGLLPVRVRRPIAGRAGRWPEGKVGGA
jgi:hypothetical protein